MVEACTAWANANPMRPMEANLNRLGDFSRMTICILSGPLSVRKGNIA